MECRLVIISAGPRFEGKYLSGVSNFLEKLAFMVSEYETKQLSQKQGSSLVLVY